MRPSSLRQRLSDGLLDFAWDEWAQIGVLAAPRRRSPWAQDPEALLIFSLEVARDDPRLLDQILDWLVANEGLLSVRRLRALCTGPDDRQLVEGALGWLAQFRPRARLKPREADQVERRPKPMFRSLSSHVEDPDPAFAAVGLLRPLKRPGGPAREPDMRAPINLAFRLRQFLGISARAEIVRYLLTAEEPAVSARSVTRSAGFAKRNVHEALLSLHASGVVSLLGSGREQRYAVDRESWMRLLGIDPGEMPSHREWPPLLAGVRELLRWLSQGELDDLSDYLLGSRARDLLEDVRSDFEQAGIPVGRGPAADAWQQLEALVDLALRLLGVAHDVPSIPADAASAPSRLSRNLEVYADRSGNYRWRLVGANGEAVAASGESFASRSNANGAAQAFKAGAESWRYEVYLDASGQYRWRARASNGKTIATSTTTFSKSSNAERATEYVRKSADSRA